MDTSALRSQILNSLAERLTGASEADNLEARRLFAESLVIKERLGDLPGCARSHGGLGRSYLEPPRDLRIARKHLIRDLQISFKIGDLRGQSKMHSILGRCDLEEQQFESAAEHYRESLALALGALDRAFAIAGGLRASAALGRSEEIDALGARMLHAAREEGVPEGAREDLAAAIESCARGSSGTWARDLLEMCRSPHDPAS